MKKQSYIRIMKRKTMKEQGITFSQRVAVAIQKHAPVQSINWKENPMKNSTPLDEMKKSL